MNNKFKTKFLTFVLCICAIASSMSVSALGNNENKALNKEKEERKQIVFAEKIAEMENNHLQLHEEEGELLLNISEIKDVYDFAGNKYTLVELEPEGYILFHDESGVFVEYSSRTVSPYIGIYNELYYAGPKEYYSKDLSSSRLSSNSVEYKNTIVDRTLSEDDITNYDYEGICDRMNEVLITGKNENIVNYIQNDIALQKYEVSSLIGNYGFSQDVQEENEDPQRTSTYNGLTVVEGYNFFTRLNLCGDNKDGTCGYLAAGMLLAYHTYWNGANYIPSNYLTWLCSNGIYYPILSNELHTDLVNVGEDLGYGYATTSREIRYTVNKYLSDRGESTNWVDEWFPVACNQLIMTAINNEKPVVWFGEVFNNTFNDQTWFQHALVVYGYDFSLLSGFCAIAHFGWTNATEVYFSGVLGSMYVCWP